MAKVKQKAAKKGAGGALTRGQAAKQRRKHKVVLEATSKEKNKLRSVITFTADPPPGYTFIPAGNPELTAALKEFARRGDNKIFAVTTTPHASRHELSREVHRIGFHFPTSVVAQVCAHYGIRLTSGGQVIDESTDDKLFTKVYQNGERPVEEKDQITINTEAKQTIKDLFPNIPDKDLFQIIKTAFQLGDNRVGTANEIPLVRRAQLSVVAHIRHVYTQYDHLLRKLDYNEARHMVERDTLTKLIEWRGDDDSVDETTQRAADDLLREVIVISDEEDSDTDSDDVEQLGQDHVQVEELPITAYGNGPGRPAPSMHDFYREEAAQGYRVLPRVVRRYKPTDDEIAQRDRSRYAVWDQAKRDYRSSVAQKPPRVLERIYEPEVISASRILVPLDPPAYPTRQVVHAPAPSSTTTKIEYESHRTRPPSPRTYIRDTDGTLYERIIARPREIIPESAQRHYERPPPAMLPPETRVRTRPPSPQPLTYRENRHSGNFDGDSTVLPSVEGPDGAYLSPRSHRNPSGRHSEPRDIKLTREEMGSLRDPVFIDSDNPEHSLKRRRVEEVPPLPEYRTVREPPVRHRERFFLPHPQSASTHVETRITDHQAPRQSPRPRPPAPVLDTNRYVERQPIRDTRDLSYTDAPIPKSMSGTNGFRETTIMQPRYPSRAGIELETSIHRQEFENRASVPVRRVYEPIDEPRAYDTRTGMAHNMASGEQFVQSISKESRTRYTYPAGTVVREPLEPIPRQRLLEYGYQ
ncbi:uncharacterized protein Z518_05809 [Rhinocladiella mackenziei CBS 650.93]|uniref:DUF2293 domain-containing protein n=1 Tax=Rhinocladiella mackenziei CBS 650.93 TaxID=1442369 RepID=A0A0D2H3E9_9EURO|nr:uncharacterized protein Z518_05809 [Rhinocladiella mackenziei CBS 650.93]KIX04938.1 hypothetical protein Z518_05809 [Rhinocladiella mackenziei CBS 650.93]